MWIFSLASRPFNDIYSHIQEPTYTIEYLSDTENITLEIDGAKLDVIHLADNWTGNISVIAKCTNRYGFTKSTNMFKITVIDVDDTPVWTSCPPSIALDEDRIYVTIYSLEEFIFDAEGDEIVFFISTVDKNISVNLTDANHVTILPTEDYHGSGNLTVYGRERDNNELRTIAIAIPVIVNPVNDLPLVELISPASGSILGSENVTFSWNAHDIDNESGDLSFGLYLDNGSSPSLHTSDIHTHNFTVADLENGVTYHWYVIPFDGEGFGECLNCTWNFTIEIPIPEVGLITPLDNVTLNSSGIELAWTVFNSSEDEIKYHVYMGDSIDNMIEIVSTRDTHYQLYDLEQNTTYYWTVIPYTTKLEGMCRSGVWCFTIEPLFEPRYSLDVSVDVEKLELSQMGTASFNVTLTNTGNIPFIVELRAEGNLSDYITMMKNITISPGESSRIPVILNLRGVEKGDNVLHIEIVHPGGVEQEEIHVTVTSTPVDPPSSISPDRSVLTTQWFWLSLITGLLIIICVLIVLLRYRTTSSEGSSEALDSRMVSVEIEHVPPGGFSKESEIDIIARGLGAQGQDVSPPSMGSGLPSVFDIMNTSVQPVDLKYTLPDNGEITAPSAVTGQTRDVKALPRVTGIPLGTYKPAGREETPEAYAPIESLSPQPPLPATPTLPAPGGASSGYSHASLSSSAPPMPSLLSELFPEATRDISIDDTPPPPGMEAPPPLPSPPPPP